MTNTPAASACPDCRALIPATMDDRARHREWHADLTAKHRGVQKRIGELADVAARAADAAATASRDVRGIEIPEPVEPMRIEEWPADEIEAADPNGFDEDDYDDDLEPATVSPQTPTTYPLAIDRDDDHTITA